jgi:hypothetical protein
MFFRHRRRREFRNSAWESPRSITPLISAPTFQLARSAMKNSAFGPFTQSRMSPGRRQGAGSPRSLQVDCQEKPKPVGFVAVNTDNREMFPFALGRLPPLNVGFVHNFPWTPEKGGLNL